MITRRSIGTLVGALALAASLLGTQIGGASARTRAYDVPTAGRYAFRLLASPHDPAFTQLLGINDHQVIAGYDGSGQTTNGVLHPNKGFTVILPNTFTSENYPNSVQTQVIGINNHGDTGGFYIDQAGATHGFLERGGTFTTVDLPGTTFNQILGLNNRGQAAGYFQDAQGQNHAWIREPHGAFLVPPIPNSQATGINNRGVVIGFTQPTATTSNAFILRGDDLTILSYPGATFTQALGENNEGQIVGTYNDANGAAHGFVYDHATFRSVDVPGATATVINGIDNAGRIVGFFTDVADNTVGFVGTPTTAQVVTLLASLKGANEVPGPGSPDGGGTALLTLDPSGNQVCYSLAVAGLAGTVSMAHIHQGAAGLTGPVVVQFLPPTQGSVSGCVTIAQDLLLNLARNPGGFYVNVHTTPDFPAGAARGQLSTPVHPGQAADDDGGET